MVKWHPGDPDYDPMYVPSSNERAPELLHDLQCKILRITNVLNGCLVPAKTEGPRPQDIPVDERVAKLYEKLTEAHQHANEGWTKYYRAQDEVTVAKREIYDLQAKLQDQEKLQKKLAKARKDLRELRKKVKR